jgi:hypothetical protein
MRLVAAVSTAAMKIATRLLLLVCAWGLAASAIAQGQPEASPPTASPPAGGAAAAPPSGGTTKLFVGAGLGAGFAARSTVNGHSASFDDQLSGATDKTALVSINLVSFAIGLNPKLYVGLDVSAVAQSGKLAGTDTHLQISNYLAALTYFPWETGLFLRAGAGVSVFSVTTSSQTDRSNGLGLLVGAGFAQQLSGAHHLTLTLEQTWQSYSGSSATKPSSSQAGAIFLGYMYKNRD